MKLLTLLIPTLLFAQSVPFVAPPPAGTTNVSLALSGTPGPANYYYWVVTNFVGGQSPVTGRAQISNGPNTISAGSSITVTWQPIRGALSYDVLRTVSDSIPATCTCAVTLGSVTTSFTDTGGALVGYVFTPMKNANASIRLDNQSYGNPVMVFDSLTIRTGEVGALATLPLKCGVGQEYFVTDVAPGANKFLCTATNTWSAIAGGGGGGNPGGADTQVQFNAGGLFGGSANFAWDRVNNRLNINAPAPTTFGALNVNGLGVFQGATASTFLANGEIFTDRPTLFIQNTNPNNSVSFNGGKVVFTGTNGNISTTGTMAAISYNSAGVIAGFTGCTGLSSQLLSAAGSCQTAGTVGISGSPTIGAIVTYAGGNNVQTPSSATTVDGSGNGTFAGTVNAPILLARRNAGVTPGQITLQGLNSGQSTITQPDTLSLGYVLPTVGTILGGTTKGNTTQYVSFAGGATVAGNCPQWDASGNIAPGAACGGGGGSTAWSSLTNPVGNLALSMGANTTTFTYGAATGAGADMYFLIDSPNNTGTGNVFRAVRRVGSAAGIAQFDIEGLFGWRFSNLGRLQNFGTLLPIDLVEGTTPTSPVTGSQALFINSATHHLNRVNAVGTVTDIESGIPTVNGQILFGGPTPGISACGGAVLNAGSTNNAGSFAISTNITTCTITFSTAFTNTPSCTVSTGNPTAPADVAVLNTGSMIIGNLTAVGAGQGVYYHCF